MMLMVIFTGEIASGRVMLIFFLLPLVMLMMILMPLVMILMVTMLMVMVMVMMVTMLMMMVMSVVMVMVPVGLARSGRVRGMPCNLKGCNY